MKWQNAAGKRNHKEQPLKTTKKNNSKTAKTISPYGSWQSSISPAALAEKGNRLGHLCVDQGFTYWLEVRASEQGRGLLLRSSKSGESEEVLPAYCSVRSKVHEYGGADFTVANGIVYFSDTANQNIYRFDHSAKPALSQVTKNTNDLDYRYADIQLSEGGSFIIAIRERHLDGVVTNDLVSIDLDSGEQSIVHQGFDFYASPIFSPGGRRLAWICWNQPDMPWDATELWVADIHLDGSVDGAHRVTGGRNAREGGVSVVQPGWSPAGVLHFISDASGFYNLYSFRDGVLNALTPMANDFAPPQWQLSSRSYLNLADGKIIAFYFDNGIQRLCEIDSNQGLLRDIDLPLVSFSGAFAGDDKTLSFVAASQQAAQSVFRLDLNNKKLTKISNKIAAQYDQDDISTAQPLWFEVNDQHKPSPRKVQAFYYPPTNAKFDAPANEKPPLIVMSHGGPTGNADCGFDLHIQFWTHRGFAVVDVNYSGSSGFGRAYRDRLKDNWGVLDVADCTSVAQQLAEQGKADADRLLIRGGSAGGYTTLCALTFYDVFAAGMSRYGVADLLALANDSHKFEARYLDSLIGDLDKDRNRYIERSPISHTDKLSCPLLILQGEDDKVVPPNQAEMMVKALQQKKIAYAYLLFKGEGHGFRKAENIEAAFAAELSFYRQILGIESDEKIPILAIKNNKR